MNIVKQIHECIGTEDFNTLIFMIILGQQEKIKSWLLEEYFNQDDAATPEFINKIYSKLGYNDENFPFEEVSDYIDNVKDFLKGNLIIEI